MMQTEQSAGGADAGRRRAPVLDAVLVLALILCALKRLRHYAEIRDIGLFDETGYLSRGEHLTWQTLPGADYSPLYLSWYKFLSRFIHDNALLYDVNHAVLTTLIALGIYLVLRRSAVGPFLAAGTAFFYLLSFNVIIWPHVTFFALALLLLILLIASWMKTRSAGAAVIGVGLLLLTYTRPELFLAFALFLGLTGLVLLRGWRRREVTWQEIKFPLAAVCIIALAVMLVFGNPFGSVRSWVAFSQHYALNRVARQHSALNPWQHHARITDADFHGARSITRALQANPRAFAQHVLSNLQRYPLHAAVIWVVYLDGVREEGGRRAGGIGALMRSNPPVVLLLLTLEILAVLAFLLLIVWRRREVAARLAHPWHVHLLLATAGILAPALVSACLIYPRYHYLLVQSALLVLLLVISAAATLPRPRPRPIRAAVWLGILLVALMPDLARGWRPWPDGSPAVVDAARTPNRAAIACLRQLPLPDRCTVFDMDGGLAAFLPGDIQWLDHTGGMPFVDFLRQRRVDLIIQGPMLLGDSRLARDAGFQALRRAPAQFGYTSRTISGTSWVVYLRDTHAHAGR